MRHASLRNTFAAGLGLLLASAAAPIALADPPGYNFPDWQQSSANASGSAARTSAGSVATGAQIAAASRKADQALTTAQQALRVAQQASTSRQSAPGMQLHVGTVYPAPACTVDDGSSFNTPDAVKLPKNAFGCVPQ